MCGIAGMVLGEAGRRVERNMLLAMSASLRHRGPDDEGLHLRGDVGLAMRRLAVVDLPGGHQPVANEPGTVHAVFNGEIYNHDRLRADLTRRGHRFHSHCDSEVIPHLYEEYGTGFPAHLEGMFAIAVWDEPRRRLVLARDRLGIKPLYYAVHDNTLTFGSQLQALLAADVKTTVDPQALSDYLSLMYIPGPRSVFAQVRKLEPASVLVRDDEGHSVRRYWQLADQPQRGDLSAREARHTLRELIAENVAAQMAADVPIGFFLSGGVDSGAVVAAARRASPDGELRTFSAGFTDASYDERQAAARVARRFGCHHTEVVVEPQPEDLADGLLSGFDEPFADPSMIPTWYLSGLARRDVTVALSGDGGDELFAGYLTYQADKIARYYRWLPRPLTAAVPSMLRFLPHSDRRMPLAFKARRFTENALADPGRSHYLWRVVLGEERKARLLHPDLLAGLADSYATHESHYRTGAAFDPLTRFQYTDTNVYLPDDVLAKVDRASMAHSLEVRVPLLATPVVEYAFSLPGRVKMPGHRPKQLLRDAMTGVLPSEIVRARKKGFNAPLAHWMRTSLRPLVDAYLNPATVRRQGYLREQEVTRLVRRHLSGQADHSRELWAVLVLTMWAEKYQAGR